MTIANIYEQGFGPDLPVNIRQALSYYRKAAADFAHSPALTEINRLQQSWQADQSFTYQLAQVYWSVFNDRWQALSLWFRLARQGHNQSQHDLSTVSQSHGDISYWLGWWYQQANNYAQALSYYCTALAQQNHLAQAQMEQLRSHWDNETYWRMVKLYDTVVLDEQASWHCLKVLADHKDPVAREQLQNQASQKPDVAYMMGQWYEMDAEKANSEGLLGRACDFYALAARQLHQDAYQALHRLASKGFRHAQYHLAHDYYRWRNDWSNVVYWYRRASAQNYPSALRAQFPERFTPEQCLLLARCYAAGDEVLAQLPKQALIFYERAFTAEADTACQAYQEAAQICWTLAWYDQACCYYMEALALGDVTVRAQLESLEHYWDKTRRWRIANLYATVVGDQQASCACLKALADEGSTEAWQQLQHQVKLQPAVAYMVGQWYQKEAQTEPQLDLACIFYAMVACIFYAMASRNGYERAAKVLHRLAQADYRQAQYHLARDYYGLQDDWPNMVHWYRRAAAQNHAAAQNAQKPASYPQQQCLLLARCYAAGDEQFAPDLEHALEFYQRSIPTYPGHARIEAGQVCCRLANKSDNSSTWASQACDYFEQALSLGYLNARTPLESLANHWDNARRLSRNLSGRASQSALFKDYARAR
jgi:TPR repeat protein